MKTNSANRKIVFRIFALLVLVIGATTASAQPYFRFSFGADASSGAHEFYNFERVPERLPPYELLRGRFGSGWVLNGEGGVCLNRHIEVGINFEWHHRAFAGAYMRYDIDTNSWMHISRTAELSANNRLGIAFAYYFGEKQMQPYVSAGARALIQPQFQKDFKADTLPYVPGGRYYVNSETYSGGLSVGYFLGAGLAFNRHLRFSWRFQFRYTWQQWKPKEMVSSVAYNTNSRGDELQSDNPDIRVPMNAFGFNFGITVLLLKPEPVETPPQQ
jgi:hypothetical protein